MAKRPIVLLLVPHLGGGGAAKVMALLAQGLSHARYDLHLALVTQAGDLQHNLPQWVRTHTFNAHRVRASGFRLLRLVHTLKPDVILSCMAHLNFLILLMRPFFPSQTRILVRQNGMALPSSKEPHSRLTRPSYRILYPFADRVICQSQAMAAELAVITASRGKFAVLPNPVDIRAVRAVARDSTCHYTGPGPHLLAVGRLSREKGFDLLLEAFAGIRRQFCYADLTIVGAGPDEASLKAQRQTLHLEPVVRFTGNIPHPEVWFKGCSLFVLSSRHEGMPNALLEAAAGGLPIVALPAQGGIPELLQGKPGVWMAPDITAKGLEQSLSDALHALEPGQRFAHAWIDDFRMDRSIALYEALIDETLTGAHRSGR